MKATFSDSIKTSNASALSRQALTDFVLEHPENLKELAAIGLNLTDKFHYKAIWILELLAEKNPELLLPYIEVIAQTIPQYKHESAIRGMSRVVYFVSTSKAILLSEKQQQKIIEICLDWLIGDIKVAPKAYAMHTLAHFAKGRDWLKEELRNIINKDFHNQSAGYKAAAREILKAIK